MEPGPALFRRNVPFMMHLEGTINGSSFTVEGKGAGKSQDGHHKGKWVCTSGTLPMSWAALSTTLGYGFKCYTYFPNGIPHFYQNCMPEGWVQEREINFEGDGVLKTRHEISYVKGTVMNKVTVEGTGFNADSPVLNDGLAVFLPSTEMSYPLEDGVRSHTLHLFPLKNVEGKYLFAKQKSMHKQLSGSRKVQVPGHHFIRLQAKLYKDVDDSSDHIVMEERLEGYDFKLIE